MKREPATNRRAEAESQSDADVLEAIAGGDVTALGTLYDRHAQAVWRVLHRVMSASSDVEDVVHAMFLKLPELAAHYDGRPSSRNWLCGIAVRLALRRERGLRRFANMLVRFGRTAADRAPADPEMEASRREELIELELALKALSPKKRAVFVLVELEGLAHSEVAQVLEIPLATVRTRLFGAKQALREALRGGALP